MDISIIIPTYNRKNQLEKCLYSIFSQSYPKDRYEVIVVDDGSSDGTDCLIKDLKYRFDNLIYLRQLHQGPAAARNSGITNAKGEIIGFVDDDCILNKYWIKQMIDVHRKNLHIQAVGGQTWIDSRNVKAAVSQFLANGGIECRINGKLEVIFLPTCNVSLKRAVLEREKFNTIFIYPGGEDLEYFWRLFKKGLKLSYRPEIRVLHNRSNLFLNHLKQAFLYGGANYFVNRLYDDHPSLQDIYAADIFEYSYCIIKEFLKAPLLSLHLSFKLKKRLFNNSVYILFWLFFYFLTFRLAYLVGNIIQCIKLTDNSRVFKSYAGN